MKTVKKKKKTWKVRGEAVSALPTSDYYYCVVFIFFLIVFFLNTTTEETQCKYSPQTHTKLLCCASFPAGFHTCFFSQSI